METIKRDTNTELMNNVLQLAKENGHYKRAEAIMDYFLPESYEVCKLTDCEFDFKAVVNFGGSEGIYIDCYIEGRFDEKKPVGSCSRLSCGTFKTLGEDLESMQIMGELAGTLIFYAREYVNRNLKRFCPAKQ